MAYDLYSGISKIVQAKKDWTAANDAGNDAAKNRIAANAQAYYNNLRKYGYGDVADKLASSDYNAAVGIQNAYKVMGKSAIRPYFYEKGKASGLSQADVDNLLSYNDKTGEVTFAGKNIGKPYAVVDGTSYWDPSQLETEWNDYMTRSGVSNSGVKDNAAYNNSMRAGTAKNDKLNDTIYADKERVDKLYDSIFNYANSDVTKSDEYKSAFENIMPLYDYKAAQGGYNAAASGASDNGGNIDSFAAANALRQQAALTAQGQSLAHQMGLEAYNARINNVNNILANLGLYDKGQYEEIKDTRDFDTTQAQQYFDNTEAYKNNELARKQAQFEMDETAKRNDYEIKRGIAEVTGITPAEWENGNNPLVDDNGVLLPQYENLDFETLINEAESKGNTKLATQLRQARWGKALLNPDKYMQYLQNGNFSLPGATPTEAAREYNMQDALERYQTDVGKDVTLAGYANEKAINDANNDTTKYVTNANNQTEKEINSANNQNALDQISATNNGAGSSGTTGGGSSGSVTSDSNGTYQNGTKVGDKNGKPVLSASEAKKAYEGGNTSDQVTYAYGYYYGDAQLSEVSDEVVIKWFQDLNKAMRDTGTVSAFNIMPAVSAKNAGGKIEYSVPANSKEFVAHRILAAQDLTAGQKTYLLKKFGYTDADADLLHNIMIDPHYK